jgi:protein involved in plasmid replication-relaxation
VPVAVDFARGAGNYRRMERKRHDYSRWETGEAHAIQITSYVLDILYELFLHGALSNAMLHALTASTVNERNTRLRTMLMKRKPNLLIEQPKQQRLAYNANYNSLTYRITDAGVQVLLDRGKITRAQSDLFFKLRRNHRTYHHDALSAYVTASIALGCRQVGIQFVGWDFILTHQRCPESTRRSSNPLAIPFLLDGRQHTLIPDALFAVRTSEGVNCFVLETDRHNEPIDARELGRSSYAAKLAGYVVVLKEELYQKHFGIPNLQVLNATISDIHMRNIMRRLREMTQGTRPFLFKALPMMCQHDYKPVISGHMAETPWQRIAHPEKLLYQLG